MKTGIACAVLVAFSALSVAQNPPKAEAQSGQRSSTAQKETSSPRKLERVHANLKGFELAPRPANTGTQIGGATRGIGTSTTLLAPHKGQAYTLRPLFQWANSNRNIKDYVFRLLSADGNDVIFETKVSGTSLKYPAGAEGMKPGGDYSWTVQPAVAMLGEAAEPAEIVIVGPPQRAEIESQLASYPENSRGRAQFFVDRRLWYDSIESYTDLLKDKPEDSQLLELRGELYEQLPQTHHAAEADFAKARTGSEQ